MNEPTERTKRTTAVANIALGNLLGKNFIMVYPTYYFLQWLNCSTDIYKLVYKLGVSVSAKVVNCLYFFRARRIVWRSSHFKRLKKREVLVYVKYMNKVFILDVMREKTRGV